MGTGPEEIIVVGKRVASFRKRLVLTQEEFAREIKVSTANVRRIERANQTTIRPQTFRAMAALGGMSLDELARQLGPGDDAALPSGLDNARTVPLRPIPLYEGLPASLALERDQPTERTISLPGFGPGAFAAVLSGDCMAPDYPDRCTVVFEPVRDAADLAIGGCYYVGRTAAAGGTATFKQLVSVGDDAIVLRCVNRASHPGEIVLRRGDVARLALAVRVVLPAPRPGLDGANGRPRPPR